MSVCRKPITCLFTLLPLVLLSACVNDAASLQIDGNQHSLSLVREQKWPWDKRVDLFVVVSRMPDCQRRHRLNSAAINASAVEVFSPDANNFYLLQGGRYFYVETRTCESFRAMAEVPPSGVGEKLGVFREVGGKYTYEDEVVRSTPVEGVRDATPR